LNAVIFVYRHILEKDIENVLDAVRAKHRRRLPLVLTASEVEQIFRRMSGLHRLMAMLIYGGGLRLVECLRLRIKDLDLEQGMVMVRSGKGERTGEPCCPSA
jgi:integrase